jgi:hypothetical protein
MTMRLTVSNRTVECDHQDHGMVMILHGPEYTRFNQNPYTALHEKETVI